MAQVAHAPAPTEIDRSYRLEDRYLRERGSVFLTGIQALVRLLLDQARLDRAAGHRTAGFVSGYRGSPLGGFDQELWRQEKLLTEHGIRFQPGLNEDLGATMVYGTQMAPTLPDARVQGVFGLWYAKGPGVDRTGDVLRHANAHGTHPLGGVLAIAGDDHAAQSSTVPHQTDHVFEASMIPVLQPSDVGELLTMGLAGFALSRFSGLWVGFKTIAENVESGRSLDLPPFLPRFVAPDDFPLPPHGLNIDRALPWPEGRLEVERRVVEERLPGALAWARANGLDRVVLPVAGRPRLGIVTTGKAHHDLIEALQLLGLDGPARERLGLSVYKVGMSWPLEPIGLRRFADGLEALLFVEEKRAIVERQARELLYNLPAAQRPPISGKRLQDGAPGMPEAGELTPELVAETLARWLALQGAADAVATGLARLSQARRPVEQVAGLVARKPTFCAGCPHNSSTKLPAGSVAGGGIGCHIMAMDGGQTQGFTHMGGEGAQFLGILPFVETPHYFQNLGDGTYQHSGSLAIRQAVAAGANLTYKILYNDAVAMTGGQPAEGTLTVQGIATQVIGEGVKRVVILTEDLNRYADRAALHAGVEIGHRDELERIQRELRATPGVTVLIYDQTCAAEKRRRRKRKLLADPPLRIVINERVCEGCGDCSVQSNCIAVEPIDTEYGRKRRINQSACNKDQSCLKGFCPSFVTLADATPRKPDASRAAAAEAELVAALPQPTLAPLDKPWRLLVTGIGGTGVVTVGQILAMAGHVQGLGASVLDFTGLSQKNGAVVSHVQLAATRGEIGAVRVPDAGCDLLLACDMVTAALPAIRAKLAKGHTRAIVNLDETPTADVTRDADWRLPSALTKGALARALGGEAGDHLFLDASRLATALFGDSIAANLFLVGAAWQRGLIPLSFAALDRAIELNGTAVGQNRKAFLWGRIAAHDLAAVERLTGTPALPAPPPERSLDELVAHRSQELVRYQDAKLAARFEGLVAEVRAAETRALGAPGRLTRAVAEGYFRVLAYKDEYEVARLMTDGAFAAQIAAGFEGVKGLTFHMAPPLLAPFDPVTGRRRKLRLPGRVMLPLLRLMARGKALRGTVFDPFGWQADRKMERALIGTYEQDVRLALAHLAPGTLADAEALARLPFKIRGYGPVKDAAAHAAASERAALTARLTAPPAAPAPSPERLPMAAG